MFFSSNKTPHKFSANFTISLLESLLVPKVALVNINWGSFLDEILALNLLNKIAVSIPVAPEYTCASSSTTNLKSDFENKTSSFGLNNKCSNIA